MVWWAPDIMTPNLCHFIPPLYVSILTNYTSRYFPIPPDTSVSSSTWSQNSYGSHEFSFLLLYTEWSISVSLSPGQNNNYASVDIDFRVLFGSYFHEVAVQITWNNIVPPGIVNPISDCRMSSYYSTLPNRASSTRSWWRPDCRDYNDLVISSWNTWLQVRRLLFPFQG